MKYYYEQICFETVGLFRQRLQSLLWENGDMYSELYKTVKIEYDPLINRRIVRNDESGYTDESKGTIDRKQNSSGDTQTFVSDNPEVTVADNNYTSGLNRGKAKNTASIDETTKYELEHKNKGEFREEGFVGESPARNVIEYRKAIISLNKKIANDCRGLFLNYYGGEY